MPKIRKHSDDDERSGSELPFKYLHVYWANWWASLTRRKLPFPDALLKCVECGTEGVTGHDLKHRGTSSRANLMCDRCWSRHSADTEAPTSPTEVGKVSGVPRDGPGNMVRSGRRFRRRT